MDKFLNRTKEMIFAQQASILSASLIISLMIIMARLFGFIRYYIYNSFYTPAQLDIFYASFRIPDIIFEILITGAITTAFIPFFTKYEHDKKLQSEHISTIINIILCVLFVFILVMVLLMPFIMPLITPGYANDKVKMASIISFSQILLVGQLPFLVVGNFITGISQARKSFLIPALAPIIYNVAIITVTLLFDNSFSLLAPVIGVVAGAMLFLVVQIPVIFNARFEYRLIIKKSKAIVEFFRMIIPRVFTVIVAQIDGTIDLTLTTLLGSGAYTYFYLAQHLQLLPVSVIGMAFGQAALPYLSDIYQKDNKAEFKKIILDSVLNLLFFTIPLMGFFIFARTPMVRFFFGGQKFDWDATVQTSFTLSYFALSLPAHSIYYFLTRCFYAMFDSKTPFYMSILSIVVNAVLSLLFILVFHLPVWSLGISFSISMMTNVVLLSLILNKKLGGFDIVFFLIETVKMLAVAFIASVCVYYLQKLLDGFILDTTRTLNLFFLLCITSMTYFLLYLFLSWIFNVKEMYLITKMILKVKEYRRKIFEVYTGTQS